MTSRQLYAAVSPALEGVTGQYFTPIGKASVPSSFARDSRLQDRLWAASEALVAPFATA